MRYPASEKLEIIRIVEKSHLPVRQTLQKLGIPRATFYRWYDLYRLGGINALEDHRPLPGHVWNRVPDNVRREIVDLALEEPTLSPRELAVRFTDTKRYFVSESSVYRLLKAHDLITSPAFIVMKAADEFKDKTTAPNQLWQTDFTTDTLNLALEVSGCDDVRVLHKPRLLSDNGSSYISAELADWLGDKGMDHTRGAPMHPQTQGKLNAGTRP